MIWERLCTTQSRQKSYADRHRHDMEFQVRDYVFLKVLPWKRFFCFAKRGKLNPKFIGPFEILERIDIMAYWVALPTSFLRLYDVFYVSVLRKYMVDPSYVLDYQPI